MVLGHHSRRHSLTSARSSMEENPETDETVIDEDQGNVLTHIISQLRPGADLSRVTLPTFILEPRSMLERITNFMAHPEILRTLSVIDDPVQRFVAVTKFYLSGWHIKPPGVKKPLNPILGEVFTGYWNYPDGTKGYYISEQTSHHPPKSSYFFMAPDHNLRIDGTLKPRSKFLGNSVGSFMEGIAVMRFTNRKERYFITQPNMYARGILFGKMKYELGDHAQVRCPETGLEVDIEFKVKGWVGGTYNAIGGYIKDSRGKSLYELSGLWHGEMFIKDLATGKKQLLFDATRAKPSIPEARPLEEQTERESQRLWSKVTTAIKQTDHRAATDEKTIIEDRQREEASQRGEGVEWQPKLFRRALGAAGKGGPGDEAGEEKLDWVINAHITGGSPQEVTEQILSIAPILPSQASKAKQQPSQTPQFLSPTQTSYAPQPSQSSQALPPTQTSRVSQAPPPPQPSQPYGQQAPLQPQSTQGLSGSYLFSGQQPSAITGPTPTNIGQQQLQEPMKPGRSTAPAQPAAGLAPRLADLSLIRSDSVDGKVDEFVDAEM